MTRELADYIGQNFTVINQVGGLDSSFDATVWIDNSGQVYVSMRGTQELPDLTADKDLAISGLPHKQLADMVNWWLREARRQKNTRGGSMHHFASTSSSGCAPSDEISGVSFRHQLATGQAI